MPQAINEMYGLLAEIRDDIISEHDPRLAADILTVEERKHFRIASQTVEAALLSLGQLNLALNVLNEVDGVSGLGD